MNNNIDEFIKDICEGECNEYFQSSKGRAIAQIKASLSPDIFSHDFNFELQIQIARIASPIIKKINTIDKNRFWIIYYRLSERLISLKCSECKSSNQSLSCEEYILDRIIKDIKKFDIDVESTPFREVRVFIEKWDYDNRTKAGVTGNYIKKIIKRYNNIDSIDNYTADALIENAMIDISDRVIFPKDFSETKINLKNEISRRLNDNKSEISTLLHSFLIELLHEEKFFNYINNHVIPKRFIDFIRYWKFRGSEPLPPEPPSEPIKLEEILADYLDIIPQDTKLILRLKIGERLNDRDFIKVAYLFDYREIDIFENFTDDEHLEIKLYARNDIDISSKIDKKISKVREKLESNSYIDIEDDKKRVTLLKLICSEEMKAKEIGMLLGYSEKQVYKKIENIKKKINTKKESALCKEM